jgi:hypothetical protein
MKSGGKEEKKNWGAHDIRGASEKLGGARQIGGRME